MGSREGRETHFDIESSVKMLGEERRRINGGFCEEWGVDGAPLIAYQS